MDKLGRDASALVLAPNTQKQHLEQQDNSIVQSKGKQPALPWYKTPKSSARPKTARDPDRLLSSEPFWPLENLLSDNGPADCLESILEHLCPEDVKNLRAYSNVIAGNRILARVEEDCNYRDLLGGCCEIIISTDPPKKCGACLRARHKVRYCESHPGGKIAVCDLHSEPRFSPIFTAIGVGDLCKDCDKEWNIDQIRRNGLDSDRLCRCRIENLGLLLPYRSCRVCWDYVQLKMLQKSCNISCDDCFQDFEAFENSPSDKNALTRCIRYAIGEHRKRTLPCNKRHGSKELELIARWYGCYTCGEPLEYKPGPEMPRLGRMRTGLIWCVRCWKVRVSKHERVEGPSFRPYAMAVRTGYLVL